MSQSIICARSPMPRQTGFSLIELMISMVIGLLLLAGITSLIVNQSHSRDELEKSSRQIENGRYAIQLIRDDIQHAGFYGSSSSFTTLPGVLPDPCLLSPAMGTPSLMNAMPLPIQGYDSPAGAPIACLPDFLPNTDVLVIRRADSQTTALDTTIGQVYIQASVQNTILATGTGSSAATFPLTFDQQGAQQGTVLVPLRKYLVHIYYISPCSVPAGGAAACTGANDDNGRPIPTLKMLELSYNGNATAWKVTPLVEGIENMQLDWGIDSNNDGYPDSYTPPPASVADWSNVMAVRINLLARNTDCTTGYKDVKTYSLGVAGAVAPLPANCTNGDVKRHAFTELVRAVNPSGRRAGQ